MTFDLDGYADETLDSVAPHESFFLSIALAQKSMLALVAKGLLVAPETERPIATTQTLQALLDAGRRRGIIAPAGGSNEYENACAAVQGGHYIPEPGKSGELRAESGERRAGMKCKGCGKPLADEDDDYCDDCYYGEDGPAQHWLCDCGNFIEDGLCCNDCGREPPWGCDCILHEPEEES